MKQENIVIRRETPTDYAAVEHLIREVFWNVHRPGCLEHLWFICCARIRILCRSWTWSWNGTGSVFHASDCLHCNSEGGIKQVISVPSTAQKLRDCKQYN